MLSESQIELFSRQILLREVGGVGQLRLCDTPVAIRGQGVALDVARQTLEAGGTPIDSGAALVLGCEGPCDVRVLPSAVVAGCRRCVEAAAVAPSSDATRAPVMLGSLAALAMQRLIVGLAERTVVATVSASGSVTTTVLACPHQ